MATKAQLEQRIVHLESELAAAHAAIAERDARIETLEERLARLEALLLTSSSNSSLPPSKNPPHVKRGGKSKPTGKPPGGQQGHKPHFFQAIDPQAVTRTVECEPAGRCGYCLADLSDAPLVESRDAVTFHQLDVPKLAFDVTAYLQRRRQCDHCHHWTLAPLPDGVSESPFGPGLVALIANLTIRYRLGRRPVAELIADLFGRRISVGAIQSALETASEAVAEAVAELARAVEASPVAGADETGWYDQTGFAKGKRCWLWMATTPIGTVFSIAPDRGIAGSMSVLGENFKGVVVCDRWKPYASRFGDRRQLCWAHLDREANAAIDRGSILSKRTHVALAARGDQLAAWGRAFSAEVRRLFEYWHAFKRGEICRKGLRGAMTSVKVAVGRLIASGTQLDDPALSATCRDLAKQFSCLWTFVTEEGVEPTNNESERELRPAVIARSLMHSTKSEAGRLLYGRLMSVSATCRKQQRKVLDYLKLALERHLRGLSPPSLVPG
jgi:transposase